MNIFLFIGGLGAMEVILVLLGVVLLFGGKKIPELMKGLGQGMNEFKKAKVEGEQVLNDAKKIMNE